jgi:curli biogenesis system outer membrane secretion channel CsgG
MKLNKKIIPFLFAAALFSSCATTSVNKASIKANNQTPEAMEVEEINIPYNASLPRFLVSVEPFTVSNSVTVRANLNGPNLCNNFNCTFSSGIQTVANDMSAQLITALSKAKNFALIDHNAIANKQKIKMGNFEQGPFLIKGTLTELSEIAEETDNSSGASFGWLGIITTIAGVVTDKPGLTWGGAGLTGLNPSYKKNDNKRTGMVAFDIQLIDTNSNRIISSDRVLGTFTSASQSKGFSILGISNESKTSAKSAISQATRVALNDAVKKIWNGVKGNNI